ncbi:alkaline phosphatase family protein [Nocardioides convexus]|uniref:alkaline phosphatase family protein n=1 Tax=Nocardioides convexus TaxID=2712224 RepID=UPI00241870D3|nr:alkaline phosphatase family protein [Nocardioides convexus]
MTTASRLGRASAVALSLVLALLLGLLTGCGAPAAERAGSSEARQVAAAAADLRVVAISLDGLNPTAITRLGAARLPNLYRLLREGAGTLNARAQIEQTVTLPNHTSMVTGRRIDKAPRRSRRHLEHRRRRLERAEGRRARRLLGVPGGARGRRLDVAVLDEDEIHPLHPVVAPGHRAHRHPQGGRRHADHALSSRPARDEALLRLPAPGSGRPDRPRLRLAQPGVPAGGGEARPARRRRADDDPQQRPAAPLHRRRAHGRPRGHAGDQGPRRGDAVGQLPDPVRGVGSRGHPRQPVPAQRPAVHQGPGPVAPGVLRPPADPQRRPRQPGHPGARPRAGARQPLEPLAAAHLAPLSRRLDQRRRRLAERRPRVEPAALGALRLLLHDRCERARARAGRVPLAEPVTGLVVDDHVPVVAQRATGAVPRG